MAAVVLAGVAIKSCILQIEDIPFETASPSYDTIKTTIGGANSRLNHTLLLSSLPTRFLHGLQLVPRTLLPRHTT